MRLPSECTARAVTLSAGHPRQAQSPMRSVPTVSAIEGVGDWSWLPADVVRDNSLASVLEEDRADMWGEVENTIA